MSKSLLIRRRVLGTSAVLIATQLLSACIVLPVPAHRPRTVIVEPGYAEPAPPPPPRRPYWRR